MRLKEKIATNYTDAHRFFCANLCNLWQKLSKRLVVLTSHKRTSKQRKFNYFFG